MWSGAISEVSGRGGVGAVGGQGIDCRGPMGFGGVFVVRGMEGAGFHGGGGRGCIDCVEWKV